MNGSEISQNIKKEVDDKEEVVQINYWMEIKREINQTINKLSGLTLLTHNSVEFSDLVDFLNLIRREDKLTIMYISLINSYKHIKRVLEEKTLESKKLFVVDCVSGFLLEIQDEIDCVYRKPPRNLKEMKDLIHRNTKICSPNMIIIDSLSQYINFTLPKDDELHELYDFLKELKDNSIGVNTDTVILLYDDKLGSMKRLPILFTNHVLKLEVIKEKVRWKD